MNINDKYSADITLLLAKHSAANDTHTVHAAEQSTTLTLSEIMWIKNT